MFRKVTMAAACTGLLLVGCAGADSGTDTAAGPVDASGVLSDVAAAMGTGDLESIAYSGSAWAVRNSFLQTPSASPPWPGNDITNYQRTIDLAQPASLATGETFNGGLFMVPPTAGTYTQNVPADQTNWGQQLEIWLTPWGFLHGAELYGAQAATAQMDGTDFTVVTWMSPETQTSPSGVRYTVSAYVNDQNLIESIETRVEHVMMGDMLVRAVYSGHQDFGGVMVPTTMVQERGGGAVFEVTVTDATANPADLMARLTPPEQGGRGGRGSGGRGGRGGGAEAPTNLVEEVADGVYLVTGGYVALVAEFNDYLAVFEGGAQNENRGQQVLAQVRQALPDKPIRYVINSHMHSDHSSGLAAFAREGITIITQQSNVEFMDMMLSTPRTLLGEPTMDPVIEGVDDVMVLGDDSNRLELHSVPNLHTDGMLVAYLPEQRILHQADFTLPAPGEDANPFVVALAERVQELGLEFDAFSGVHAPAEPETQADLMAALP